MNTPQRARALVWVLLAAFIPMLLLASGTAEAKRQVRITVGLHVPTASDEGAPISVSYKSDQVPRTASLVIQHSVGTAKAWKTFQRLRGRHGSATLPTMSLGVYIIRIAAISRRGGHKVLAAKTAKLKVFGTVQMAGLVQGPQTGTIAFDRGTYTTPTQTFSYVMGTYPAYDYTLSVSAKHNDCRSVHLALLVAGRDDDGEAASSYHPNASATVSVVQESRNPVTVKVLPTQIMSIDTLLVVGQSWSIRYAPTSAGESDDLSGYYNGYASCLTRRRLYFEDNGG